MFDNSTEETKTEGRKSDQMLLTSSEFKEIEESKTLTIEEERIGSVQITKAGTVKEQLRQFLLNRSKKSLKFAHLVFWYLLAGIDDSESI